MKIAETLYNQDGETAEIRMAENGQTCVCVYDTDYIGDGLRINERRYYTSDDIDIVISGMYKHGWRREK